MVQWGWRPLICCLFISVILIVACSASDPFTSDPPPTLLPVPTLIIHAPRDNLGDPHVYLPLKATIFHSVSTPHTKNKVFPTLYPLEITIPTCYETFNADVECFGLINNPYPFSLHRITIEGQLIIMGTTRPITIDIMVDQKIVPSGTYSPYRLRFETDLPIDQLHSVQVSLTNAERIDNAPLSNLNNVQIEDKMVKLAEGQYIFYVQVTNQGDKVTPPMQLIIILYDDKGRILNYRLQNLNAVAPSATDETVIQIITRVETTTRHETYVVGR